MTPPPETDHREPHGDLIAVAGESTLRSAGVARLWLVTRFRYALPVIQTLLLCVIVARGGDVRDRTDNIVLKVGYLPALVANFLSERLAVVPAFAWICLANAALWYWIGHLIDDCLPATIHSDRPLPTRAWLLLAASAVVWSVSPTDRAGLALILSALLTVAAFYRLRRHVPAGAVVTIDLPRPLFRAPASYLRDLPAAARAAASDWRDRLRLRHYLSAALVVWVLATLLAQSPRALGTLLLIVLVNWVGLYWIFPGVRRWRWLVVGLALMVSVLSWIGSLQSSSVGRDFVALILASVLVAMFSRTEFCRRLDRQQIMCFGLLVILGWLFWSAGDSIANRGTPPLHPDRFSSLPNTHPGVRIAAALSGGGYRAALVHAGVLSTLDKMGIRVSNLSTVSGGSIAGSFYALGGAPEDFLKIVSSQDLNLKRQALDAQNLLHLAMPLDLPGTARAGSDERVSLLPARWRFTTTDLHAEFLDRHFLAGKRFRDRGRDAPALMIDATDLRKGQLVGIGRDFLLSYFALSTEKYGARSYRNSIVSTVDLDTLDNSDRNLSTFVAASAAFPVVFEPKDVTLGRGKRLQLADGGLIDNSGTELLFKLKSQPWEAKHLTAALGSPSKEPTFGSGQELQKDDIRLIIAVDAGDNFEADAVLPGWQRATAIMSQQVGTAERITRGQLPEKQTVTLSPADYFDNWRSDAPLALVEDTSRTDRRSFDPDRWYFATPGQNDHTNLWDLDMLVVGDSALGDSARWRSDIFLRDFWRDWPSVFGSMDFSDLPHVGARSFSNAARSQLVGWIKTMATTGTEYDNYVARRKAGEALAKFIIEDFTRCLGTFRRTTTLRDNIPRDDAVELFRLGVYLTLFARPEIETVLSQRDPAAANRARVRILTSRQQDFVLCNLRITPDEYPDLAGARARCRGRVMIATAEEKRLGQEPH